MATVITILIILILSILTYQDFKFNAISWFLIPLALSVFLASGFQHLSAPEYGHYIVINLITLFVNLLGVLLIVSIKERKLTNIIDSHLGLGDVLFFVVLTTCFSPLNFIIFYIGSMVVGILTFLIIKLYKKDFHYFPLAGSMSLTIIIIMLAQQVIPSIQLYTDLIAWI